MPKSSSYKTLDYEFGILIQSLRHKAGLTQPQLADTIDVAKRTIINWETGDTYPQINHLRKLIKVFYEKGCFTPNEELREAEILWEKATHDKTDVKDAFNPNWFNSLHEGKLTNAIPSTSESQFLGQDWSEAVINRHIYGRENELAELSKWINKDNQQLIIILGMGGIGKTTLAVSLAHQLATHFDFVIFRSLHNAPNFEYFIDSILKFILGGQLGDLPASGQTVEKLTLLMDYLIKYRCLLVLDNYDSILEKGLDAGNYSENHTQYSELLRRISEISHRSCLLLTSREKPQQLGFREEKNGTVRSLILKGLDQKSCQAILNGVNINSSEEQGAILTELCGGNPLALKLIAEPIRDWGGDINSILANEDYLLGGISEILDQHFARLSSVEQEILFWLTLSREPLDLHTIQRLSHSNLTRQQVAEGVRALLKRFLIEPSGEQGKLKFTLQGVIFEYITTKLLNHFHSEIVQQQPDILCRYPIVMTQTREYIRQAQHNAVVRPLLTLLNSFSGGRGKLIRHIKQILTGLQRSPAEIQGFAGGNLVNLLVQLGADLRGWDLSNLNLWQANLVGLDLYKVNLTGSDLQGALFTEADVSSFTLACNPQGDKLAIGCTNGAVKVWNINDLFGSQLFECLGHTDLVRAVAFSPDGTLLASGGADGTIRLWEMVEGKCVAVLKPTRQSIYTIAFSPDGNLLACGGEDQKIYLWQVSTLKLIQTIDASQSWIMTLAFSPDSQILASGGFDYTIKLWNVSLPLEYAHCFHIFRKHSQWVSSVKFSPDGSLLASSSADGTVMLWDIQLKAFKKVLKGHKGGVMDIDFSPDGNWLASGSLDTTIRIWKTHTAKVHKTLNAGNSAVSIVKFSANGETLISNCSEISTIKLWSTTNLEQLDTLQGYNNLIYTLAVSPDGGWLVGSGGDFRLLVWNLERGLDKHRHNPPLTIEGHTGLICTLAFSPDGSMLASGSGDCSIRLLNLASSRTLRTLIGHTKTVMGLVFLPGERLLASVDEGGVLKLWSLINGVNLASIQAHEGRIRSLSLSPDGKVLATCGDDGLIQVWQIDTQNFAFEQIVAWHNTEEQIMGITFSRDGTSLFSCGSSGAVCNWNWSSGELLSRVSSHKGLIWRLVLSQDGKKLASAGEDGFIRLWQVGNEVTQDKAKANEKRLALLAEFEHGSKVMAIAFTPDSHQLFSTGAGGEIKLWDVEKKALQTILGPYPPYYGLNITAIKGINEAQRLNLLNLGAMQDVGPREALELVVSNHFE